MRSNTRRFIAIAGIIGLGLIMPLNMALAEPDVFSPNSAPFNKKFQEWSAEWWQFVFSIPPEVNPNLDENGEDCMVGQHGPVWFLTGALPAGTLTRTCAIPEGKALFFPVINYFFLNTPNVCGQGGDVTVDDMRSFVQACADRVTMLSVEVDGEPLEKLQERFGVKSVVFEGTFPEDNIFDGLCAGFGGFPGGTYSPGVDEGFYVMLKPLSVGKHVVRFQAESPACPELGADPVLQDITYNLTVVPVSSK